MRRTAVAALALTLLAPLASAEDASALLRLRAFAVDMNNAVRTGTIDIVIERWSTPEETQSLRAVLVEKGDDKLLSALQKVRPRCGYARTSTSLGWDIYYAREIPQADGSRRILLATDRPVNMWEARNSGRSMDYQFSLAEIRLPKDGKGVGKAIPRAQLTFNPDTNTLEIENFQREPVRLNEVTVIPPKG